MGEDGMRSSARLFAIAGALAVAGGLSSCAGDMQRDEGPLGSDIACSLPGTDGASDRWSVVVGDFNGDSMTDVVWSDPGRNIWSISLMNGTQLLARGPTLSGPNGAGWLPTRPGDLDGDGLADLFWDNPGRNVINAWLMHGTQVFARGPELPGPTGGDWVAVTASGDFNGDGMADVLWNDRARNALMIWLMAGTQPLAPGPEIPGPSGAGWEATAAGDFNSDGLADVLWSNRDKGAMAVYLMNGTELLSPGPEIPAPSSDGWRAVKARDFNLDGMVDVLWSNTGRSTMAVYLMNGAELLSPGPEIPGPSGAGWTAASAGDFNLDGMADALWFNPRTPSISVWLMAGTRLLAPGTLLLR